MGVCKYCGKPAGFFHHAHTECEALHASGPSEIRRALESYFVFGGDLEKAIESVLLVAGMCFISSEELKRISATQISAIERIAFDSRPLNSDDEARIDAACKRLGLKLSDCRGVDDWLKKSKVLRLLNDGQLPKTIIAGYNPIQLQKAEQLVWTFNNCQLLEFHKDVSYVGATAGISVRVAKGVYLRTSSSRGQRIEEDKLSLSAIGDFLITSKNVYFASIAKTLRIPLRSLVAINLFSDAVQLSKASGSRPLIFKVDDPPYAANLLSHLMS